MLRKLSRRLTYANVMSTIAVVVAVGTGSAYAANTVFSTDIVDGQVKSVDIGNNEIGSSDVKDNSLNTFDVHSFLGVDVVDESLTGADVENGSIQGIDITDDALTGEDIDAGSIFGGDIAPGQITKSHLQVDAVGSAEVENGSLTGTDIADNSVTGFDINEATLVGVKDVCHAGAVLRGRLCAGSDGGLRNQNDAFDFCESIGLRLPTLGEAKLMARNYDVPGVAEGGQAFWTDSIANLDGGTYESNMVGENGQHIVLSQWTTAVTVCVETPTNVP